VRRSERVYKQRMAELVAYKAKLDAERRRLGLEPEREKVR
jgi:hypothetical protein